MLKDFIKYVLFLFHFRDVVPARYINRIKIKENNEELAVISNDADLFFSKSLQGKNVILRKIVYEKIKSAGKKYLKKSQR